MVRRTALILAVILCLPSAFALSADKKKTNGHPKSHAKRAAVDRQPPVVDVSSSLVPANGGLINNSKPAISVDYADEGIGVSTTDSKLYVDEQDVTTSAQITSNKTTYTPADPLADGAHKIKLIVMDKAGNASTVQWSFTIRTQPPQVKITSHKTNQFVNKSPIVISGSISDPKARIVVNGINAFVNGGTFTAHVNLIEGNNAITAVATDIFGNTGSDVVTIIVDTKPPVVEITAPTPSSLVNSRLVTVTGLTDKNTASVMVSTQIGSESATAVLNAGSFTAKGVKLAEGMNVITVRAVSQAGNVGTASVKVMVDSIAPKLMITAPSDMTVTNKKMIAVSGTVDKPSAMVKVNNTPVTVTRGTLTLSSLNLVEGNNIITVTAVDRAGNEAKPVVVTVVLDTTPPASPTLNPLSPVTRVPQVTVTGSAEPGAKVEIFVNSTVQQEAIKADEKGAFSYKISLAEGNNAVSAVAYDSPGNASAGSAVVNVFLDTKPPRIL
ncbi:MAG TPA: Ig-like domain-containing protein [Nitrospirota bacterium]|nr:Ig-like domain-containing protein [Nitrospirota bacterium]